MKNQVNNSEKLNSNKLQNSYILFILFVLTAFSSAAQLRDKYDLIEKEYSKNNYKKVIKIYNRNENEVTGKKYVLMMLMVAEATCNTGKESTGQEIYHHLINDHSEYLDNDDIKNIKISSSECRRNNSSKTIMTDNLLASVLNFEANSRAVVIGNEMISLPEPEKLSLAESILRLEATSNVILTSFGKEYSFTLHGAEKTSIVPKNQEVIIPKSMEKFKGYDNEGALNYYKSIHNNESVKFAVSEYFIISSYLDMPQTRLDKLANELDDFYKEVAKKYALVRIPYKIAINIAENRERMQQLAKRDYGLEDVGYSIGFSRIDSYSMLCMVPKDVYVYRGTIRHELLHLILNYNISNLPPWFSEGLPALYEAVDSNNKGIDNWRLQIINALKSNNYKIDFDTNFNFEDFLNAGWYAFNGINDKDSQGNDQDFYLINHFTQSVNYAIARYFILYLQNTNQLDQVFEKITKNANLLKGDLVNYRKEQTNYILQNIKWENFKLWLDREYPLSNEMRVQQVLKGKGFYEGEIDGAIGPGTKKALMDFQKKKGIKVSGIIDNETLIEMGINKEF